MMRIFFCIILPLFFLLTAIVFQLISTIRIFRHKSNRSLVQIFVLAVILGLFMPILALLSVLFGYRFMPEVRCMTGIEIIPILGTILTLTLSIILLFFSWLYRFLSYKCRQE
jgi:hypothetical protein